MELISTRDRPERESQLRRDDWIVAAIRVLLEEGVESVQITRLARELNVTRGSFYWHFKKRDDLLGALLDEWSARNTGVMVSVLRDASTLEEGILNLFFVWVDHSIFSPDLDQAIRDWGRRDADVGEVVAREDDNRVNTIARFFVRHGYRKNESYIRARVIYFTQLSYYALGVSETMEKRLSYLSSYFLCFTGRDIDSSVANVFRERMLAWEKNRET